jgi:hypothetical protein
MLVLALLGCRDRAEQGPPVEPAHEPAQEPPLVPEPAANPVQHEMRLLSTTLEGAVRAIGSGDVRGIEHDLHRLHSAKEATEAALREGRYRPPKSPDQIERFFVLDEAFHGDLGSLVTASRANDVPAAAEALGAIMRGCHGCHSEFRD